VPRPKILYLGNCQAEAMASLAVFLGLDQDHIRLPPVWTLTDEQGPIVEAAYREADYIFLQRVDSSFPVPFVKADYVRSFAPNKTVVTWPNIYFDGYFPGIRYLYGPNGKIEGPLSDYHFEWIIESFKRGLTVDQAEQALRNEFLTKYPTPVEDSIENLRMREKDTDAKISDYILTFFRHIKLFYTMNHPHSVVLVEMLRRLHRLAQLPFAEKDVDDFPYHLNFIDIGSLPLFNLKYHPTFTVHEFTKGVEVDASGGPRVDHPHAAYKVRDLIHVFYSIYASHANFLRTA